MKSSKGYLNSIVLAVAAAAASSVMAGPLASRLPNQEGDFKASASSLSVGMTSEDLFPNRSFIDRDYGAQVHDRPINDWILDSSRSAGLRSEIETIQQDYDYKNRWDLSNEGDHRGYVTRFASYMEIFFRGILSYQLTENVKKAETNSESVRTFTKAQAKVQSAAKRVSEQKAEGNMFDSVKFGSKVILPRHNGNFWVKSPLLDVSLDVQLQAGRRFMFDPLTFRRIEDVSNEFYTLSLKRQIPIIGVNSSVSYGGTSTRISASLSKQLTKNISAEYTAVRGANSARAGLPEQGERTLRLSYGLNF